MDSKCVPLSNKSKTLPTSSSVLARRCVQPTATFLEVRYGDEATPSLNNAGGVSYKSVGFRFIHIPKSTPVSNWTRG
jgi:hypothetical protein